MGQDFMLLMIPPVEADWETVEKCIEIGVAALPNTDLDDYLTELSELQDLRDDLQALLDEGCSDDEAFARIRPELVGAVLNAAKMIWFTHRRDVTYARIKAPDGTVIERLCTGGMSAGDDPTAAWGPMQLLVDLDVYNWVKSDLALLGEVIGDE